MPKASSTSARSTREASGERSSLFVGSAEKTFRVLHAFDGPNRQMTLADLAKASSLDRSAAQRIVHTLEALGYLARVPETRDYRLTTKVLQFSYNYIRANELIDKASPYLLDISRHLGETTNLHEIDGNEIVFVARFPGRHLFNVDIALGARLPALYTASGIAILSRLPEKQLKAVMSRTPLERMTPYTETDQKKLLERVHQASRRGYSVIENETVLGDIAVAAPITDHDGTAVAAVNISVPTTRWTIERVEAELVKHVQVAATSISKSRLPMSRR
ncbi:MULTISPECIES: IclR family transcriptional regulator [unclassified Caballeronia]|uniref:IclR family transcriptional regulator n=1 Tax=unclassified Caballeronia TaxID=2646786 RepID=UPI0020287547|nr:MULTISPECIES: IclR family transcriptional regulator C-terminal domain-containing protein [unclassified Caballeronia]MDR5818811.1 IclR family transcriptional regulator C-terminal domain-containing protein [Caballeronia sp. LZ033]MDR5825858.1 IclR family transcriptional regulator C-terminal domain-containing protein [Caballeronia sp. LZ043]MDR5839445.1 IclR family transcriptional regulator C-terminal domain-containing protein [Caballeronia sp. LZ034LL]MDR5884286.1 IclR family transcriptional r